MRASQLIMAIAGLLLLAGCAAAPGFEPPPLAKTGRYTDKQLYHDITAEVASGQAYHAAAAELHRAHGYPLKPGFTVRLPTLAWASAALGWTALKAAAFGLLALLCVLWFFALRTRAHWSERLLAAGLVAGGGVLLTGHPVILHERWAGLFLAMALAVRIGWRERWPLVVGGAALALAFRELALPFVLLALACALWERQWREASAWAALTALFGAMLAAHLHAVSAQVLPGDLATQGWFDPTGPVGALKAVIFTSVLQYLPGTLAIPLALLPLLGWLGLGGREGWFCVLLFGGYALMFGLLGRPDTFYWGAVVQPAWFVGLAFLPRLTLRWHRRALDKRRPAPNLASTGAPL
jgi:hypothetical protein